MLPIRKKTPFTLPKIPQRGFTLIEILVVITIISILIGIGVNTFTIAQKKARDTKRKADLHTIQVALEAYKTDHGTYPVSAENDTSGWDCGGKDETFMSTLVPDYLPKAPTDPVYKYSSDGNCSYRYYFYNGLAPDNTYGNGCPAPFYALGAKMEVPADALNDTIPSCYDAPGYAIGGILYTGNSWWYNEDYYAVGEFQ